MPKDPITIFNFRILVILKQLKTPYFFNKNTIIPINIIIITNFI
ncbi:hypothetical protein GCM10008906_00420 [Clostridium oceanicum]|uniref:Uncharacterized protein n=1 Tax=Clostridium oceanicum TaxID=1543 RepID=A0ABP3UGS0_9CLOT